MSLLGARMSALLTANPMISKELRGRMRGARSIVVLSVYLGLLSLFCVLFYWIITASEPLQNPYDQHMGRDLLYAIVVFETLLVAFLAPAFTVGAISGERERQTFDLLMTTLLRPRAIVLGKIGAALAYLLLLILAVAPLESLAFMFGGVSPEEIGGSLVVLCFAALLYGSIGFFWSTVVRSTVAATVLTYGTVLLLLAGLPFIWIVANTLMAAGGNGSGLTNQPVYFYLSGLWLSTNPIIALAISETLVRSGRPLFVFMDSSSLPGHTLFVVQPWLVYCLLALLASAGLLALSARWLPPVRRHRRAPRQPALVARPDAGPGVAGPPLPPLAPPADTALTAMPPAPDPGAPADPPPGGG